MRRTDRFTRDCLVICVLALACSSCDRVRLGDPRDIAPVQTQPEGAATNQTPSEDDVRERLSLTSAGQLAREISAMAMETANPAVCAVLRDLWEGVRFPRMTANEEVLMSPTVRLALASTLNRCAPVGNTEYYAYVNSILDGLHPSADRMRAAISLGAVGTEADVEKLLSLAFQSDVAVAVGAVGGLSLLDSRSADEALRRIADTPDLPANVRSSAEKALEQ